MSTAASYFCRRLPLLGRALCLRGRRLLLFVHDDELSWRSCRQFSTLTGGARISAAAASAASSRWLKPQEKEKEKEKEMPSLMLSSPVLPETRYLYNLNNNNNNEENEEMSFSREMHLPQIAGHTVMESSQGYIISVDPITADLHATDPLTGFYLPLPPTSALPGISGIIRRPSDRTILHFVSNIFFPHSTTHPHAHTCYLQRDTTTRLVEGGGGEGNYNYSNNHRGLRSLVFLTPKQFFFPIQKMCFKHYRKAILSPSLDTLVVIIGSFYEKCLAFAPITSASLWTYLPLSFSRTTTDARFCDIIFHDGRLHALDQTGALLVFDFDLSSSSSNGDVVVAPNSINLPNGRRRPRDSNFKSFLVESPYGNDLFFLVADNKYCEESHHRTRRFNVFKLDKSNYEWNQVESIGDLALFVGLNQSLALSAHDFPNLIKPNHIYFTQCCYSPDPYANIDHRDTGVFNLKDGTIQRFTNHSCPILDHWQSAIWFTPATC